MSKPKIEKTQQKTTAATVEKEESEEEGENSKDEAKPPTETPSSQVSSPSVTLSSLHQCPSLPTAPATPTTTSSPLISVAGATPETTASSLPTTSPPFLPPPPPLTIISAENNEETPSNSKPILPFSKADENKKEEGSNDQMSSLKLFKNTPGKPKESIFETKHSNLYALDKDYLSKLIETKQKYERLLKSHMKCVPEDELKEREKSKCIFLGFIFFG
uniref:Uncharacterized protein n=1 Tax=Panagrolaimus superbus TaxID=310955 RepID=A0A914Z4R2_9BILA